MSNYCKHCGIEIPSTSEVNLCFECGRKEIQKVNEVVSEIEKTPFIKVKYHDPALKDLCPIEGAKSDWIDLRSAETVEMKQGEYRLISLGVSMQLPKGCEAHVAPRSSTFKNFGIILANSIGIIDESYCGDNDIWRFPAIAMRDTVINKGDRICQFRIMEKMPKVNFIKVETLGNADRGGIGSTGIK